MLVTHCALKSLLSNVREKKGQKTGRRRGAARLPTWPGAIAALRREKFSRLSSFSSIFLKCAPVCFPVRGVRTSRRVILLPCCPQVLANKPRIWALMFRTKHCHPSSCEKQLLFTQHAGIGEVISILCGHSPLFSFLFLPCVGQLCAFMNYYPLLILWDSDTAGCD